MKTQMQILLLLAITYVPSAVARVTGSNATPIIFANNVPSRHNHSPSNPWRRRGSQQPSSTETQLTSSSYAREYDYETGEHEQERLNRIRRELKPSLGGYRPWSINTSHNRPGSYSLTSKIVIANVAIYALQMVNPSITQMFAKRSDLIMQGKQLYRLFTPMFLHGSVSHLLMNSFSLNNIGPEVERMFGSGRFVATYIAGGVAGNLMSAWYLPNPSLGASGAVFGLMGAYYAFLSQNERLFGRSGQNQMGRITSTLGMNILFGLASPMIDNWAHIGGGIGGAAMAITFGPKLSLLRLPSGGRIIVDKPAVRLPPYIESIPGKVSKRLRKGRRRMQVHRYQSELSAKPWRKNRNRWKNRPRKPVKPLFGE